MKDRLVAICFCFLLVSAGIAIMFMPYKFNRGVYPQILEVQRANATLVREAVKRVYEFSPEHTHEGNFIIWEERK